MRPNTCVSTIRHHRHELGPTTPEVATVLRHHYWHLVALFFEKLVVMNPLLVCIVRYNMILTLILLTWRIWWAPNNASKWQMGFNSAFKGLKYT